MTLAIVKFIHLVSLVVWIGTLVFFSFFAAPSIFKVLPRETAGDVVGAIFPKYWAIGYIASIAALGSLIFISYAEKGLPAARIAVLAAMTAVTFYSGLAVGSKARAVKAEMRAAESPEKKAELRGEFKRIHAKSSVLNLIVIALGLVVVYLTSTALRL